jgi:hypothetical protein
MGVNKNMNIQEIIANLPKMRIADMELLESHINAEINHRINEGLDNGDACVYERERLAEA